jgi:Tol biopolymer transport system component
MPLATGSRLGPYEIVAPIGAGGMGEVYKASDTRLERVVAIKVLPSHLAERPELRQRFEREAKAISSLSHPNICTLFDVGREAGTDYLVMEHLEGETLADRLARGALPAEQALRIGIEIASALDKAHRQGIVHRDLKPGNVMLTRSGAKVLDFGLAKIAAGPAAGAVASSLTSLPTEMGTGSPLTSEGTLLGTFQYMAPEQLEGAEADARTDVFALGTVLYEMTAGRPAFQGKSRASLISAIMSAEPQPLQAVQPMAPPALDRVIRTCLAKDPEARIQTAHDVMLQLQWIAEGGSQAGVPAPVAERRRRREGVLRWVAGGAAAAALLATGLLVTRPRPHAEPIRFQFQPPSSIQVMDAPVVSPDGRTIAFNATDSTGVTRIWLRPLASLAAVPLPGTEGTTRPFWSPDSRYLAFVAGGKLKKVQATGGPPIVLCDAPTGSDGTWGERDIIVFDGRGDDPLLMVSAGGGVAAPIVSRDTTRGETAVGWPEFLPGGRHFVYLTNGQKSMLRVCDIQTKQWRDLFPCDSRAVYAEPGHLLFSRNGTLVSQPFDARSRKVKGDPVPVAEQVITNAVGGADFSVSDNGVLAFAARAGGLGQVVRLDRSGRVVATLFAPSDLIGPALSPDARSIAIRIRDMTTTTRDIWVLDLTREVASRLTFDARNENYPLWSPDGKQILYYWAAQGAPGIYVQAATGAGRSERLLPAGGDEFVLTDWSRDGRYVFYDVGSTSTRQDVWVLPMTGERKPFPFLTGPYDEVHARISPDGRWVAYTSDESGRAEVYVQSFPEPGGKWQVSTNGGSDPCWRGDGTELYYLSSDQQLMSMPLARGAASFEVVVPRALFPIRVLAPVGPRNHYAVTDDGQTFYTVAPLQGGSVGTTNVVVNWAPAAARR